MLLGKTGVRCAAFHLLRDETHQLLRISPVFPGATQVRRFASGGIANRLGMARANSGVSFSAIPMRFEILGMNQSAFVWFRPGSHMRSAASGVRFEMI